MSTTKILHWHGYEWTGAASELKEGDHRRPVDDPMRMPAFMSSTVPPIQTGHWLMRRKAAAASRTWVTPDDAIAWLLERYECNPPSRELSYVSQEDRVLHTRDGLINGVDAWWHYYTGGMGVAVFAAICCPHTHLQLPCPLPPS